MAVVDCAFQQDTFQNDAFQVCIPVPPTPVIVSIEQRRWPGPSILVWSEDLYYQRQRREENEIVIL